MKLAELTWPDVEKISRDDVVVVVSFASFEQHSWHLPFFTDTMILEETVRRLDERISDQVLVLPVQWLGYSYHHSRYGGTLSARSETHLNIMQDIVSSVVDAGFKKVLILNSHGGNSANISVLLQRLREQYEDVQLYSGSYSGPGSEEVGKIQEAGPEASGHAGETETSMIMALRPELVRTERMEKDGERARVRIYGLATFKRMDQRTDHGGVGDPTSASPEKGERFFEAAVEGLVKAVAEIRKSGLLQK